MIKYTVKASNRELLRLSRRTRLIATTTLVFEIKPGYTTTTERHTVTVQFHRLTPEYAVPASASAAASGQNFFK